ncbi:hypothetical protein AAE478_009074 [Parahypoxylon ruwenzoriense]
MSCSTGTVDDHSQGTTILADFPHSSHGSDTSPILEDIPKADLPGMIGVCDQHRLSICPTCLFNCQQAIFSNDLIQAMKKDMTLELAEGNIYSTWPKIRVFSWSPGNPNFKLLETLCNPDHGEMLPIAHCTGWFPRFIPQLDEQVRGSIIWDKFRQFRYLGFKTPVAHTPDYFGTLYCKECHLTWLKGQASGALHLHPSHNTLSTPEATERLLDERSIMVNIAGTMCSKDQNGLSFTGLGIYFGPMSKYNHSEAMYTFSTTKQAADLHSARLALWIVRERIIPDYLTLLERHGRGSNDQNNDVRIILTTDSMNLVDTFCDHLKKWVYDPKIKAYRRVKKNSGKWRGKGDTVKSSDIIVCVQHELGELENCPIGVEVVWYYVPTNFNKDAIDLANSHAVSGASRV